MTKKLFLAFVLTFFSVFLISCKTKDIPYTDDSAFNLKMKNDTLKILQLTDLHLTYGFDHADRKTFKLIKELSVRDDYDLIVITGDLTMSPVAPLLIPKLVKVMEKLNIPWTFVLGNHESDYHQYEKILNKIPKTKNLLFKRGTNIMDGGYGNFVINVTKNDELFYKLYLLDTKNERTDTTEEEGIYDYLSVGQVEWYQNQVMNDTVSSLAFMHIPLRQFILANEYGYEGIFKEKQVYAQARDTGFFDAIKEYGRTKAVFVGHDHLNDFSFTLDGIYLAYGRVSGYNAYGYLKRGGRHIEISPENELISYIVTYDK